MDDKKITDQEKAKAEREKRLATKKKKAAEKLKQKRYNEIVREGGIIWGVC